jgi:hypothetical protein
LKPQNNLRVALAAIVMLLCVAGAAGAQELDPGAYWALPTGLNVVSTIAQVSTGEVNFDPALPVEEVSARFGQGVFVYTRALNFFGRSSNLAVQVPFVNGHVEGRYRGEFAEVDRGGLADPRVRLAVNLYGAPAMAPAQFANYSLKTVVGASVTMVPPIGSYDDSRLLNIGSNRWSAKPELGLSHAMGPWVFEAMLGAWFFSDNDEFLGRAVKTQSPIASTQFHLAYRFRRNLWLAGDANFYVGGRTTIDGEQNDDRFRNSRIGATFSAGINRRQAIRASVSFGAFTTIGGDFMSAAIGFSHAW